MIKFLKSDIFFKIDFIQRLFKIECDRNDRIVKPITFISDFKIFVVRSLNYQNTKILYNKPVFGRRELKNKSFVFDFRTHRSIIMKSRKARLTHLLLSAMVCNHGVALKEKELH